VAWHVKRGFGSWYGVGNMSWREKAKIMTGPAHAVYFATYEAVKQSMGGNDRSVHHPLAAGEKILCSGLLRLLRLPVRSDQWSLCNYCE
jgi:hypothetical protein